MQLKEMLLPSILLLSCLVRNMQMNKAFIQLLMHPLSCVKSLHVNRSIRKFEGLCEVGNSSKSEMEDSMEWLL